MPRYAFIWVKIGSWCLDAFPWRGPFGFISKLFHGRIFSWLLNFLLSISLGCLLPLNKYFFSFLQKFIFSLTLSKLFHFSLVHTIVIFGMSFNGFAFAFAWFFRWNVLWGWFEFIFLFVSFDDLFVVFN